ncbi:rRNA pseudouridine synthase [Candidatus Poribacteria bacterium]|nr:rRNA pseudouridine synthase [Candidatus Poribacteria bacterium]
MRLEKYIATSGIASRRAVKRAIREGHITVNGAKILIPGHPIDVEKDIIEFEGKQVQPLTEHIYLILNKPAGYLTTRRDERGRPTVMDLLTDLPKSIYPVGRLDLETEGLLLFTNDGNFANRLMHPSHEIEKTYLAWVNGIPSKRALERLRNGIAIPGGKTAPAKIKQLNVKTVPPSSANSKTHKNEVVAKFRVIIHEGKKRQVRLMFKAVGHRVIRLKRTRIGALGLGNLPQGQYRFLTPTEVAQLQA